SAFGVGFLPGSISVREIARPPHAAGTSASMRTNAINLAFGGSSIIGGVVVYFRQTKGSLDQAPGSVARSFYFKTCPANHLHKLLPRCRLSQPDHQPATELSRGRRASGLPPAVQFRA